MRVRMVRVGGGGGVGIGKVDKAAGGNVIGGGDCLVSG